VIRELAENPNLHQPLSAGRELVLDPAGRYAVYLAAGTTAHDATVQRVRCASDDVTGVLAEVRALLRERGRPGAEWELGASSEPADLVERLLELGLRRDEEEPVAVGMVLRGIPAWKAPPDLVTRRVTSLADLVEARRVQSIAFGDDRPVDLEQA
jgi:hypothetical protein